MPRLDFYVGYELQASIKLETDEVTLGRDASCTIQMPDPKVSRLHAVIQPDEGGHEIESFGSNGTRVNKHTLQNRKLLRPGDAIFIASYILVYQPDDAPVRELDSTVLSE